MNMTYGIGNFFHAMSNCFIFPPHIQPHMQLFNLTFNRNRQPSQMPILLNISLLNGFSKTMTKVHSVKANKVCSPIMGTSNSKDMFELLYLKCLIQSAILDHKDCHFKFQSQMGNAKVIGGQSENVLSI